MRYDRGGQLTQLVGFVQVMQTGLHVNATTRRSLTPQNCTSGFVCEVKAVNFIVSWSVACDATAS